MIWIGIAVGVSVAFLICIIGLSAMTWSIGKEKTRGKLLEAKQEELHRNLQAYWSNANAMQKEQVAVLKDIMKQIPPRGSDIVLSGDVELSASNIKSGDIEIGDEVMVHDRYRFCLPLLGIINEFSDNSDGISVRLLESNNATYPIGSSVWVSRQQIVPTSIDGD